MSHKRFGIRYVALAVLCMVLVPAPAAVITVTSTGDTIALDGLTTLREAITSINNQADINADATFSRVGGYASTVGGTPDVINFNIPGSGVQTISPTSAEPAIVAPLTINGYSQTGTSANTLANSDNAVILIRVDGASAGASVDGLTLGAGSGGSTIQGLDITSFTGNGIVIQSNGNSILGNFVGVDPTGTTRAPIGTFPTSGDGIRISNASNNQIGSTSPADRNIVSGSALNGIHILGTLVAPATGNMIQATSSAWPPTESAAWAIAPSLRPHPARRKAITCSVSRSAAAISTQSAARRQGLAMWSASMPTASTWITADSRTRFKATSPA